MSVVMRKSRGGEHEAVNIPVQGILDRRGVIVYYCLVCDKKEQRTGISATFDASGILSLKCLFSKEIEKYLVNWKALV